MKADTSEIFNENGIALKGYDVVAYFTMNKAVKGNPQHTSEWKGKSWYFISADHLNLFERNPEKYAPQFGGYCAFGVSNGYKATTKPEAFSIVDNKLYFNFAQYVKLRWAEKQKQHIGSANDRWEEIKNEPRISARPIPIWWKYQFLKLVGRDLFE